MAGRNRVKIMHPQWVEKVWQKTQASSVNISASDEQFDCFKLPCFIALCVTSTGMKQRERDHLKTLIEENGGRYSGNFNSKIDMLFMEPDAVGSEKHKAAMKLNKHCLRPAWIADSISEGYALPFADYEYSKTIKSSTPTKNDQSTVQRFCPDSMNLSDISRISMFGVNSSIDETMLGKAKTSNAAAEPEYRKVIAQVTLQAAKKAGNILDGHNFYLSGFTPAELQCLGKILCILGGTKIDELSEQVTHVLVGLLDSKIFSDLDELGLEPSILSCEWLQKIVVAKKLVPEEDYEIQRSSKQKPGLEKPSPASKKAMKSLSGTFKRPQVPKLNLDAGKKAEPEDEILNQYLAPHNPSEDDSEASSGIIREEPVPVLTGKTVFVFGFKDPIEAGIVIAQCEKLDATLVDASFKHPIDYIVTPLEHQEELNHGVKKFSHIVTPVFLDNCITAKECLDISFHHKPLLHIAADEKPLIGEKFVVTNYKEYKRAYLKGIVELLGGEYAENLKRLEQPIVLTPTADGRKFESAKMWNFTALTAEWLQECMEKKQRVDETPYLVGGTKPSSRNVLARDTTILSSQGDNFDALDPPVENFADEPEVLRINKPINNRLRALQESPQTPTSPGSPNTSASPFSISKLVEDLPTPHRQITKAILIEGRKEMSQRQSRMQANFETPTTKKKKLLEDVADSPMPALPDFMKTPDEDYGIRPNSTPGALWFHKRKFDGLDAQYISPYQPTKRLREEEEKEVTSSTPFSHRRYDFYKSAVPGFNSPDPRLFDTQQLIDANRNSRNPPSNEATKCLNFDDATEKRKTACENLTDDTYRDFRELEKRVNLENARKSATKKDRVEAVAPEVSILELPQESESLVDWRDSERDIIETEQEDIVRVFAIAGLSGSVKSLNLCPNS